MRCRRPGTSPASTPAPTRSAACTRRRPTPTSRGALGVERLLTDREQGPLNLDGVNVLRIFPGSGRVIVWGARTTVDPDVTDWLYVNVRRLLLFIEESIQEGIRWAVFEPNDLALWQKLKRTITDVPARSVGGTARCSARRAEEAFYVRIDEALNPPSERSSAGCTSRSGRAGPPGRVHRRPHRPLGRRRRGHRVEAE